MLNLTAAFLYLLQSDSGASPAAAPSGITGFSALADLMGNIGPVAIGVLLLLLFASLYSWTVILGKIATFKKATNQSRRFIRAFRKATQLKEIAALTGECAGSPLAQVFEDVYETYKRQTGGWGGAVAQSCSAGADGADGAQRGCDKPGAADAVAGDDCIDKPVCGAVRNGDGRCGCVSRPGNSGIGHAACGCAGHCRSADYHGGRLVCCGAGGGGLQPAFGADSGLCFGHRRFFPGAAELVGGDSGADWCYAAATAASDRD